MSVAAASLGILLIVPLNPSLFLGNPCLSQNFLGHVKDGETTSSIFRMTNSSCVEEVQSGSLGSEVAHVTLSAPASNMRLVWIEQEAVEGSLFERDQEAMNSALDNLLRVSGTKDVAYDGTVQQPLRTTRTRPEVLYSTEGSILLALPSEEALSIDTRVPRFWKSTLVPDTPTIYRVPSDNSVARVRHALANLKFNPTVAAVVNNISIPQIWNDVRFLTGEDGKSGIISRHSFTTGALTAASWIKKRIEETGAKCRLEPFLTGFAPNVIWCDTFVRGGLVSLPF